MNLKQKMIIGALLITVVPVAITGTFIGINAINQGQDTLERLAKDQLISLKTSRKQQIETYLQTVINQIKTFSNDRMIIEAMWDFKDAFATYKNQVPYDPVEFTPSLKRYYNKEFGKEYKARNPEAPPNMNDSLETLDNNSRALQYTYISSNPNPLGKKDELVFADDKSEYSRLHKLYHPHIRNFLQTFGYYDIFLVNAETGHVVYTVFKELDYATSLLDGPYADSGLGRAFQAANRLNSTDEFAIDDYAPYLPSYQDQAMFIASPIFDNDKKIGILIFQAPIDRINAIMTSNRAWKEYGLGESGETYLVGKDLLMRNDSRFLIEDKIAYLNAIRNTGFSPQTITTIETKNTSIGLQIVDTPASRAALSGISGFRIFPDYRNVPVLSAFAPIDIPGLNWALMAEIDEAEAFGSIGILKRQILQYSTIIGIAVLIAGGILVFFFIRNIIRSIGGFEAAVDSVVGGNRNARAKADTNDELGHFGLSLNKLLEEHAENLNKTERENEQLNDSIIELLEATAPLRSRDLTKKLPVKEDITGPLADAVNETTSELSNALQLVQRVAVNVGDVSQAVKEQSNIVSEAAANERQELEIAVAQLTDASASMTHIAELSQQCNTLATDASSNTHSAHESVTETIRGLTEIREAIHETEKRMKRLGDRSQEINSTVDIINNIAERTHVLALNASMQAAAAGEEGRGFAVIADEVQRLAESAREATSQISNLVQNIQMETKYTTETMSKTVSNVVTGSKIAGTAGQQMSLTEEATRKLAASIKEIAGYSEEQAQTSKELRDRASRLQHSADKTRQQLEQQDNQTGQLIENANKLLNVVQQFILPDSADNKQLANETKIIHMKKVGNA